MITDKKLIDAGFHKEVTGINVEYSKEIYADYILYIKKWDFKDISENEPLKYSAVMQFEGVNFDYQIEVINTKELELEDLYDFYAGYIPEHIERLNK